MFDFSVWEETSGSSSVFRGRCLTASIDQGLEVGPGARNEDSQIEGGRCAVSTSFVGRDDFTGRHGGLDVVEA